MSVQVLSSLKSRQLPDPFQIFVPSSLPQVMTLSFVFCHFHLYV